MTQQEAEQRLAEIEGRRQALRECHAVMKTQLEATLRPIYRAIARGLVVAGLGALTNKAAEQPAETDGDTARG